MFLSKLSLVTVSVDSSERERRKRGEEKGEKGKN
jgi:hypothetical protein